jgi:hypothetical protein
MKAQKSPEFTLTNPLATRLEVQKSFEEFTFFATTTHRKLVELQEKDLLGPGYSDLRVLCRLDISALLDRSGRVSYFVNEVTDPTRMSLFLRTAVNPRGVSMDIAIALRTRIALTRSIKAAVAGRLA